ncbi:MAG: hypothetical protein IPH45_20980 [Bacteroidales bacterium]|nr:hypothetical protein [Bacteroidales bacterium]
MGDEQGSLYVMDAAVPEYHGVPEGDSAFQQSGSILLPTVAIASKFSQYGITVDGSHRVLKFFGPAQVLVALSPQSACT